MRPKKSLSQKETELESEIKELALSIRERHESLGEGFELLEAFKKGSLMEVSDDQAASMVMAAIHQDDPRAVREICEEHPGWIGAEATGSASERENPALAALVSPHGTDCFEAMNNFYGDVWRWSADRWPMIHWAVAMRSEQAVRALMRCHGRDMRRWKDKSWGPLGIMWTIEDQAARGASAPGRSAMCVAAQMGDGEWMERLIEMAREQESQLGREWDPEAAERSGHKALTVALFESALDDLRQACGRSRGASPADRERTVETLLKAGFKPDGSGFDQTAAIKMIAAVVVAEQARAKSGMGGEPAMIPEGEMPFKALLPGVRAAQKAGSMRSSPFGDPKEGAGLLELAGWSLDAELEERLLQMGVEPEQEGWFEQGAVEALSEVIGKVEASYEQAGGEIRGMIGAIRLEKLGERLNRSEWRPAKAAAMMVKAWVSQAWAREDKEEEEADPVRLDRACAALDEKAMMAAEEMRRLLREDPKASQGNAEPRGKPAIRL